MWPNPQFPADLVTFAEEILNGKLRYLRSVYFSERLNNFQVLHLYLCFFGRKGGAPNMSLS